MGLHRIQTYPAASYEKESEIYDKAGYTLTEMSALTTLSPSPVPTSEFCLRPENMDLKGLCK